MTEQPAPDLIHVRGLTKTYGDVTALHALDLDLAPGQVIGLLGENGCGKTTLLKVLAGVLADYTGEVRIAGHAPGPQSKALASFLPDVSFLPDGARAGYCLDLYSDFFPDFQVDKARDLIGFFGLEESMRLKAMSKGMREKVQIALAMSRDARVFLLDEPISGVDPAARQTILDGILRNFSEESLLLISTHLVHDLEALLDSVVMMRQGQVMLSGEVDDLRAEHGASLDQIFRKVYR
ncbi:ABC transporter ATP-binding protein [Ornithinimicrobium faecis]|uniref:ABC transporter ATP-binding protein n=1 Tax=Ornithinimicrobium faecis TaxID=2934158 RepID=A0ABY4YWI2_9MICO|nr:ABC transporter ATP-binding protein [Ornithinimicrobium sp. HY1793]USQ81089.1 ABC transporter ATP-binding protein [Ornithinimicrobium sp. HY1793]